MKAQTRLFLQLFCLLFFVLPCDADPHGHLHQIWRVRLADVIQNLGTHPLAGTVFGVTFSPDGQRILIVYGASWKEEKALVLNASNLKGDAQTLDINPQYWESSVPPAGSHIRWSGQNVAIGYLAVQLVNGSSCAFHDHTFALPFASDQLIHSWFEYYDWNCRPLGKFARPANWSLLDVSAEQKLLCVRQDTIMSRHTFHSDILIVDAVTGTILMKVPCLTQMARFADRGKVICGMRTQGNSGKQSVSCWDIGTGKESASLRKNEYVDIQPAINSSRIAILEYGTKFYWLGLESGLGLLKKRVIWDFRTGQELVSWKPKYQDAITDSLGHRGPERQAYRFAFSPDGEFIVEGGAGEVILYRIES